MKGRISIEGLEVECIIGVHAHERVQPQTIIMDVELEVDVSAACRDDAIAATVDYEAIANTLSAVAIDGRYQLLETLADACATAVLQGYAIHEVSVSIRKPEVVTATKSVGVSLTKRRSSTSLPPPSVTKPESKPIEGLVACLTGGLGELAFSVAAHLLERGADVFLMADSQEVEQWASCSRSQSDGNCSYLECDFRSAESVSSAFDLLHAEVGHPDALVHFATAYPDTDFDLSVHGTPMSLREAECFLELNLLGTLRVLFEANERMRRQGQGAIVAIGTESPSAPMQHLGSEVTAAGVHRLVQLLADRASVPNVRAYWLALPTGVPSGFESPGISSTPERTPSVGWAALQTQVGPVVSALITGHLSRLAGSAIQLDATTLPDLLAEIGSAADDHRHEARKTP